MKILFIPQVRDNERITYEFEENSFKATHKGKSDTFDFANLPNGELELYDDETGEELIETDIENPIVSARKEDGVLYVELMNYIGVNASYEERFPDWIDHTEYEPPSEEDSNDEDDDEEPTDDEPVVEVNDDNMEGWDEF